MSSRLASVHVTTALASLHLTGAAPARAEVAPRRFRATPGVACHVLWRYITPSAPSLVARHTAPAALAAERLTNVAMIDVVSAGALDGAAGMLTTPPRGHVQPASPMRRVAH
jgi:hypothetical protein